MIQKTRLAYCLESAVTFGSHLRNMYMVIAANEQVEAPEAGAGKAPWTAPRVQRLDVGAAEGGDSIAGDNGGLS